MLRHRRYSGVILGAIMLPHMAYAVPNADPLAEIEAQIADFTKADLGTPGGLARPLDRRLRLKPCPDAPQLRMGPMLDHIIISCAATGWRFTAPLTPLPGTSVQATVGGAPIRSFSNEPALIRKGDRISLIVPGAGFAIETQVIAEEDGDEGATIRVRMASRDTGKTGSKAPVLRARVISADRATLP